MSARGTIFLTDAEVLQQDAFPGDQYILRLQAPKAARAARPGSFAHVTCDPSIPLRRPLSIMRTDPDAGWLELLYKPVGVGLEKLATRQPGDLVSTLAPIGNGFDLDPSRPRVLALGGGVGIPPMLFLALWLDAGASFEPIVLMGSEVPFPFELEHVPGDERVWPAEATMGLALLTARGIESRLASMAGLEGAFPGYVTDLARSWLDSEGRADLDRVQITACGPEPMLAAAARLAADYGLPCQIAVEEFMACGVGGCAGCTVLVHTPDGPAMKRVCVDGPVFDAHQIYRQDEA